MKRLGVSAALVLLAAGVAFGQEATEALNASRKVEIAWPQYGVLHAAGSNFLSGGFDVAVRITPSVSVVGELRSGVSSELDDALISYRAGVRFNRRTGRRMTTFVEGLAGGASGFSVYSSRGITVVSSQGSGLSLAGGGGIDIGLKKWLGVRVIQADYEMTRSNGNTQNGFRVNAGLIFRLGSTAR